MAHFGVDAWVEAGVIAVSTEFWHQEGTPIESITLRVWMPEVPSTSQPNVRVVSDVEGDSRGPVSLAVSTPGQPTGTVIELSNVDDNLDQTFGILDFVVEPLTEADTKLNIQTTMELVGDGLLSDDYTLEGELQLEAT
jgi:hypothetical protein